LKNKLHVLNLGCSKNLVDSESIAGDFLGAGFSITENPADAEYTVINTCGFIDSAKEESVDEIMQAVKNKVEGQKIIVAGCLSQRYLDELKNDIPEVDLFTGTYKKGAILEQLDIKTYDDVACETGTLSGRVLLGDESHHAFVKVAEGCNRTCSFCAIPGMRGKQNSRPIDKIITEINSLHSAGIKEISLVAQDLTFYGREKNGPQATLDSLITTILAETDMEWLRLMYAYPAFINDPLIDLIANEKRVCNYIDMPIQHGSDRVLKWMRRGHTRQSLLKLLRRLRDGIPDLALRTTLLLGFPGEKDEDFEQLLDMVEEFKFDRLGCFTYSDEEGTSAFDLDLPRVPLEIAQGRAQTLMGIQQNISLARNEQLIGKELEVIIDSVAEGSEFHYYARTQWDAPEVDNRVMIHTGDADVGTFRKVLITDASEFDLEAKLIL
jgi:ribosomal protein S12 methylthiotransferase